MHQIEAYYCPVQADSESAPVYSTVYTVFILHRVCCMRHSRYIILIRQTIRGMMTVYTVILADVMCLVSCMLGQVCYSRLGCFTDEPPWSGTLERPISRLPWSPQRINTRFLLYTRGNLNSYQEVRADDHATIANSNFQTNRISRFIIHGFIDNGQNSWLVDMCQAILQAEDVNCFCVDWSGGSLALYTQAANNIRVVGAEIAYFIDTLLLVYAYSTSKVHLIGHSLGAHAAGEAGKRRPGLQRISGLDPAQPYFQYTPPVVRLDPSDALLVDAIHTDGTTTILKLGNQKGMG
ncbi:Belongs to the AB hydrolase superfamily. Lipase family, partial [Pristimantis euphronides]